MGVVRRVLSGASCLLTTSPLKVGELEEVEESRLQKELMVGEEVLAEETRSRSVTGCPLMRW